LRRDNPLADDCKRSIGLTRSASIGRGLVKIESRIDNLNSKVVVVALPVQPTSPTLQEPGLNKGQAVIDLSGRNCSAPSEKA
jgi:prephenate dehydrogenase